MHKKQLLLTALLISNQITCAGIIGKLVTHSASFSAGAFLATTYGEKAKKASAQVSIDFRNKLTGLKNELEELYTNYKTSLASNENQAALTAQLANSEERLADLEKRLAALENANPTGQQTSAE